jgi:hypothetical protein
VGVILFGGDYSVELCRQHPTVAFVFGDNLQRRGKAGQAIIRSEPNAVGVATKRLPSMHPTAFFRDGEPYALQAVLTDIGKVQRWLHRGRDVVIPVLATGKVSLGCGRAKLDTLAPTLYGTIQRNVEEMIAAYGEKRLGE